MATCIKTASALFASLLLNQRASEIFNKSLGLFRHVEPQVFADDSLVYYLLESNHNALESYIYKCAFLWGFLEWKAKLKVHGTMKVFLCSWGSISVWTEVTSSCLPSLVFSRLHWLTLAFGIDSTLFSGWSRFTMTWMPARDSLPSHYVSVHWLLLRDRIFNDRYSGLRVVGMLTFHHLWDLSSGGTHCFPLSTDFFFFL